MNTTDEKYKNLINKLQSVQPQLNNPEELTENIMKSIQLKKQSEPVRILIKARPWISIAAVFLLGLFIFQQTEVTMQETKNKNVRQTSSISSQKDNCLSNFFLQGNSENSFFESYLCYLRQSELDNDKSDQLLQKFQN